MGGCTSKPKTAEYDVGLKPVEEKKSSFSDVHLANNPDSRRSPSLRSLFNAQEGEGAGTDWKSSTTVDVPAQERHSLAAGMDMSLQDSRENEGLPVRKQSFLSVLSREIKGLVVMSEQTKGGNQASTSESGRAGPSKTNDGKCDDGLHVLGENVPCGFDSKGGNGPSTTENRSMEPAKTTTNDRKDDSLCVRGASTEVVCLQSRFESDISSKAMDSVKQEKEDAVQRGLVKLDMAKEQKPVNNGGSECNAHQNGLGKPDSIKEIGRYEPERLKKDNLDESRKAQVVNERIGMPKGSATEESMSINCVMDLENTSRADLKDVNDPKYTLNMGEGEKADKGMMKNEKGNEEHLSCRDPASCAIDLENSSMADQKGMCRDNGNVNDLKYILNMVEGEKADKGTMKHEKGNEEHLIYKGPVSFAIDSENTSRADCKDVCRHDRNVNGLKHTLNMGEGETVEKGMMKHEKGNEEHLLNVSEIKKQDSQTTEKVINEGRLKSVELGQGDNLFAGKTELDLGLQNSRQGEAMAAEEIRHNATLNVSLTSGSDELLRNIPEQKQAERNIIMPVVDMNEFPAKIVQKDESGNVRPALDLIECSTKILEEKKVETGNIVPTFDSNESHAKITEEKDITEIIVLDSNECSAKILEEKDENKDCRVGRDSKVEFSEISEEEQKRSLKPTSVLEQNLHPVLNSGKSKEGEEGSKSEDPQDEGKRTDPKEKLEEESMRGDIEFCDGDLMTAGEEHNKEKMAKSDLVSDELRSGIENVSNDLDGNGNIEGMDLKGLTEKDKISVQSSAEKVKEAEEAIAADGKFKEEGMVYGIEFCDEKGAVKPFLDMDGTKKGNRKSEEERNDEIITKSDYEREDICSLDPKGISEKEEKGMEGNISVQRSSNKVKEEEEATGYKMHTLDFDDSIDTCKLAKLNNGEVGSKGLLDNCLSEAESGLDFSSVANVDIPLERLEGLELQDQDKASITGSFEAAHTQNSYLSSDLKVHNICGAGTEEISSFIESSVQNDTEPADSPMPSNKILHETLPCLVNLSDGNVTESQHEKMDEHSNYAVVGKPAGLARGAVGKAE